MEPAPEADWPQWRGADGMAVSRDANLPTHIGADSPELLWKAEVPGDGASSPIVKGERVFLTTAYPNEPGAGMTALRVGIPLVCFLGIALLFVRRPRAEREPRALLRLVVGLDGLFLLLGTLLLGAGACVLVFRPELLWEPGAPGYRWFYTSLFALTATALSVCWMRPGSAARFLVALALVAISWMLFHDMPTNRYREAFDIKIRLAMIAPGLAGAAWHALAFLVARRASAPRSTLVAVLGALTALAAGWGTFWLTNRLVPSIGMVRAVLCYDFDSGKHLWTTPLFAGGEETKYDKNTYATPTACATEDSVFAHFGAGFGAVDHDGDVLWKTLDEDYHLETRYGASSSPILMGDAIVYAHDKEAGLGLSYITCIEIATGKTRWYRETEETHDSYTTPLLIEREGEPQLVTVTNDWLLGYDPRDGERLWRLAIPIEQMVPSLQIRGDLLLVSGGTHAGYSTNGVRLSGKGKDTRAEILWQTKRAVPGIASPVLVDDGFYTVDDQGIMTCYAPETGEVRWQERLGGGHWSSLVAGDGKVYALDSDGVMTTVKAAPAFEVLARGELGSTCHATPAIARGRMLVRTERELYCFGARD